MTTPPKTNAFERVDGPSAAARRPQRSGGGSVAAIHVLKSKLNLSDDDYRVLIKGLTLKSSSKDMSEAERQRVREHLRKLAERMGVVKPRSSFAQAKAAASPMERKVWAMWHQLGRRGVIANPSAQALRAWVKRQTGMDDMAFCTWPQMSSLIEALKCWQERGTHD